MGLASIPVKYLSCCLSVHRTSGILCLIALFTSCISDVLILSCGKSHDFRFALFKQIGPSFNFNMLTVHYFTLWFAIIDKQQVYGNFSWHNVPRERKQFVRV